MTSDHPKNTLKILIVDDDSVPMMVHQMMLQSLGHAFHSARTGTQALKLCANGYDVIFMDIGLPDIDGLEVTRQIREWEHQNGQKPAYIAGITAYSLAEMQEKCLKAGMNRVLLKPITIDQLKDLFKECC
jgi:CheY-like chemotaxis protein